MMNLHGTYIGGRHDLKGQSAMLMVADNNHVKAQFDNIKLAKNLSHAWPKFKKSEFRLHVEVIEPKPRRELYDDDLDDHCRFKGMDAWREFHRGGPIPADFYIYC